VRRSVHGGRPHARHGDETGDGDGSSVGTGDTLWFESENVVLEPAECSYTVTLPDAVGGDSMTGSFRVG
jgi:hypothetical protein